MNWKRAALLARKRLPAGKSPALPKQFFSFKTPELKTRASTPEQFKPCCVRRALIQRRKERAKRRYPLQAERINASGVRWRRVLENACAKKRRCNPDRIESGNLRRLYGSRRRNHERRSNSVMTIAGSDQRNRALMKRCGRGMKSFM